MLQNYVCLSSVCSVTRDDSTCMKAPSKEICNKSTQRNEHMKVRSVGYVAVADNSMSPSFV